MKNTNSIEEDSNKIWWKWANLQFLSSLLSSNFTVPEFASITDFSTISIDNLVTKFEWKLVAVRSSWTQEDSRESSFAWCFQTYLNIPNSQIKSAIEQIHLHSREKTGEVIPIVVQEMVPSEHSGVIFTYDTDLEKPYFVISLWEGLWESLVSWEQNWKTYKIYHNTPLEYIPDERLRNLFIATKEIQSHYPTPYIDIEFWFKNWSTHPYILQVRPITTMSWNKDISLVWDLAERYARMIAYRLQKTEDIYGNMIDINPEELVWNQPHLIQSFFEEIFPKSSLVRARKEMWYRWWSKSIMVSVLDKPYISLSEDLDLFLPNSLSDKEVLSFKKYYKRILISNPSLQNQLDTVLYPNNIEQVEKVINSTGMSDKEKVEVRVKFQNFFLQLESVLNDFEKTIETKLVIVFEKLSQLCWKPISNIEDLTEINYWVVNIWDINSLTELIKELTYIFVFSARWAFYFSWKDSEINEEYFKSRKYEKHIYNYMTSRWKETIDFSSVEWFNFLQRIDSSYSLNWLNSIVSDSPILPSQVNDTTRFMVYRENVKYLFSRLFLILWNSMNLLWGYIDPNENFSTLLQQPGENKTKTTRDISKKRQLLKERIRKILILPPVLHGWDTPLFLQLDESSAYFIWTGELTWEILHVEHVSELSNYDLNWKIICIENATPEIDVFLPSIAGIITRNGWPLAHIAIRAREYKIPTVVWVGDIFDKIKKYTSVRIDFTSQKITHD